MLRHPCIRRESPTEGNKIRTRSLTPAFFEGPKEGGNATPPLHSRGVPNKGEQNQNSLPQPQGPPLANV